MLRQVTVIYLCVCLIALCACPALAAEQTAREITGSVRFSGGDWESPDFLTDGDEMTFQHTGSALTLESGEEIGSVYLVFDQPCSYTLLDPASGDTISMDSGFLHDYVALDSPLPSLVLQFPGGADLCEIRVFAPGQPPESIQQWSQPLEGCADVVLFSTHGDDEQLYFAGLLPEYAGQRKLGVQVVYMTGHDNLCGSERKHEMLNGLWAVGVRAYPVFGPFPDFKILNREGTYAEYERLGFSRADLLRFVVGNLRRFRPQVAIGHDLQGEYGHGMHMVYADLLTQAVEISPDATAFPEQVSLYGTWDVPKTYLHLYPENPVTLDYDQPLDSFGGMTAFQVTQKRGFPCHASQQYELYTHWLYGEAGEITAASQITQWSLCRFGLYRSTVGADVEKNDFMEHLTPYPSREPEDGAAIQTLQEQPPEETGVTVPTGEPPLPTQTLPAAQAAPSKPAAPLLTGAVFAMAYALLIFGKKYFEKK